MTTTRDYDRTVCQQFCSRVQVFNSPACGLLI